MDTADIRIKEHFGLVTNDTSTIQFSFLISPPKNRETIEKNDIVCFNHPKYGEACQVLAEVKEITSYEEVAGSTMGERVGKMLASAKIIGYVDLRSDIHPLRKLLAPPNPGSRVYMPYASFLEDALNRGANGEAYAQPLRLGKTEIVAASQAADDQQIDCYLDATDLTGKHTLICGMDGAGKTHLATVIIEEIANKTNHPIVVFDPNNEYSMVGTASALNENYPFTFQVATVNANAKNTQDLIVNKIRRGQVAIIVAEGLTLAEKNSCYTNILNILLKSRREKLTEPFILMVEDADNFPLGAIEEVVGSKNGIAAILISSHPTMLGGRILSKTSNQIAGRTIEPEDVDFLKNMLNGSADQVSSLRAGEWVINGINVARPTKFYARERYSKPKVDGIPQMLVLNQSQTNE